MTTGDLTTYTVDALAMFGVTLRRNNCGFVRGKQYGIKGWPDLLGYDRTGRMWGVEIKNRDTKDRMREHQEKAMARMAAAGCKVAVVTCMGDVDRLVRDSRSVSPQIVDIGDVK